MNTGSMQGSFSHQLLDRPIGTDGTFVQRAARGTRQLERQGQWFNHAEVIAVALCVICE